jgi:hypothetical protein
MTAAKARAKKINDTCDGGGKGGGIQRDKMILAAAVAAAKARGKRMTAMGAAEIKERTIAAAGAAKARDGMTAAVAAAKARPSSGGMLGNNSGSGGAGKGISKQIINSSRKYW